MKLSNKQQIFCEELVKGASQSEAYRLAGYSAKGNAAESGASRLLRNAKVSQYIENLRRQAAEASEIEREEMISVVCEIIRAKPSEASAENPLCELKMSKAGEYYAFPSKAWAIDKLCKLMGWDAPQRHEVQVDDLRQIIARQRARQTS